MVRGFRICSNNKDILDARSATKAPRFLLRAENMADAKKLSSMDASFLYLETPEMPMHVGSMAIFRLPENYNGNFFEDFKAMIASRLHIAPILKARLEKAPLDIDHPSWVEDDQFDIDRHIFRGSLPAPYDRATLERQRPATLPLLKEALQLQLVPPDDNPADEPDPV